MTLGANFLVIAQTIPQNAHRAFFYDQKLRLLKIFIFWIWLRFLRYGILQIWQLQIWQLPDSKNTFSPISINQNDFVKKIGWYTFFLLYLWAKYELIWSDIAAQTVTLGANLLVMAQTIPQNAHRAFFYDQKLRLLKIFKFWIWLRFLRYGIFAILNYASITVRL